MSDSPIDKKALFEIVDRDPEFLEILVDTFLNDCPVYMDAIRTAVREEDAQALEQKAHGLKGAVANLQAASAQEAAHLLEVLGRSGELEEASLALERLETEIDRLTTALRRLIDTGAECEAS